MTPPPDPATQADVEAMQAGAETDAVVAREVFGLEVVWTEGMPGDRVPFIGPWRYETWPGDTKPLQVADLVPEYSSDIAAAWQVVDRMIERGMTPFSIGRDHDPDTNFFVEFGPGDSWAAEAETAPLAICRAALRAAKDGAK